MVWVGEKESTEPLSNLEDQAEPSRLWSDDSEGTRLPGRVWHGQVYASGRAFPLARIRLTVKLIDRGEACVLGQHILLVSRPQPTWSLQPVSGFKPVALRL